MNYATLAFSKAARKMQEEAGSRANYARMEKRTYPDGFTKNEISFIAQRDSFYMATVGKNGFPYIQFRGGPKGFLHVLDQSRLGFVDVRGNMQYVSAGNLITNKKVALILMDYPTRTRLKIYAEAETIELKDNPELLDRLFVKEYDTRVERMMLFHVKAYDWNCPQYITPRYTLDEMEGVFTAQRQHISQLENEIRNLKSQLIA